MFSRLEAHITDPAERLLAISAANSVAKQHSSAIAATLLQDWPLHSLGSEVKAMYPLGPIFHGCGLNITVMSLNGSLDIGLISCPELLPDLWGVADDFAIGPEELLPASPEPTWAKGHPARDDRWQRRCVSRSWQHVVP